MKLGLIGFPLSHSYSKKYFEEKFKRENITGCSYELYPIESIDVFPELVRSEKVMGLNVTIPYKESVLKFCNQTSQLVKAIGAANCLKISDGFVLAENTDAIGFEKSIMPLIKNTYTKALVLGSGGSSRAVQYVLRKIGLATTVVSRKKTSSHLSYEELSPDRIAQYDVIVNTTPLGMFPNQSDMPPIPIEGLNKDQLIYDLIYNPPETMLLKKAASRGAHCVNGMDMFIIQAEESWKIWNRLE
ncbi:MAG: shikimate dehydrogenase [Chitinophagales bacterium]|nr:shikimate dehydrogenase [Chitinophagales bacterium]MDW8274015.1 shikimate dehydrogenase [Chitinophagales bacterium]